MFQTTVQDGLARCGVVICKQGPIVTPTPMLYTRRGSSVFLTPDMLEKLRPQGAQLVQVNALQL
jgi:queuine/archaeosine tRNA-ribosyltransferase